MLPLLAALVGGVLFSFAQMTPGETVSFTRGDAATSTASTTKAATKPGKSTSTVAAAEPEIVVTHVPTPTQVKAIYMTSWVASTRDWRAELARFIDTSELNAIVIDIKDYSGRIAYPVQDPVLKASGAEEVRVPDMKEFIAALHAKGIYVIGRVAVFQDTFMVREKPEWAVKRASDGGVWKDRKGIPWIDAGNPAVADYAARIGKDAHAIGFDEINYDYIRFPSDGNMKDIAYPYSEGKSKAEAMRVFFAALGKDYAGSGIPISADLFGMTTTNTDDLGIGQVIEVAFPYFDYIAPMVYPSHYPPGFNGWKNPNDVPYEIIKFSMDRAVERAKAFEAKEAGAVWPPPKPQKTGTSTATASTTPSAPPFVPTGKYVKKLRPWLQDFDYGGDYDAADVRAQIRATYDAGLDSWMIWDPGNKYTRAAFEKE